MNNMNNPRMPQRILARLQDADALKWSRIIEAMLERLQLKKEQYAVVQKAYKAISDHLALQLETPLTDVHILPQGSMRTQTTVRPRGLEKFDLDIVTKLLGPKARAYTFAQLFDAIGRALQTLPGMMRKPEPKNRCWRVWLQDQDFYFDITPAVPDDERATGASLKVPDMRLKQWWPSNPEEFATEFERVAALRFHFQEERKRLVEARKQTDPLPPASVPLDDVLRRVIQLMKLHRGNFYWYEDEKVKAQQPISVIIVTLAMRAYERLWLTRNAAMRSNIQVALEVIEMMPALVREAVRDGKWYVTNPKLPSENFADRWNELGSARAHEFFRWHEALEKAIELLFEGESTTKNKELVRSAFGQAGVDAFDEGRKASGFLDGFLATTPGTVPANPRAPVPPGSSNTLA